MRQDVLVYGIGAQTNDFNTPGVQEHAFFFKELTDARKAQGITGPSLLVETWVYP